MLCDIPLHCILPLVAACFSVSSAGMCSLNLFKPGEEKAVALFREVVAPSKIAFGTIGIDLIPVRAETFHP